MAGTRQGVPYTRRTGNGLARILAALLLLCLCGVLAFPPLLHADDETAGGGGEGIASAIGKPAKIRLFGTLEFRGSSKNLKSWNDMLARNARQNIFAPGSRFNRSTTWDQLKAEAAKLSPMDQLKLVNKFWNQWPYRQDPEVYGKPDYWACPAEFRKNSGDCEDYSIAKYFTLRELGFPVENMRVVVIKITIRNLAHAVLVVYMNGDAYVLDNLSNNVLSHTRYKSYLPQYSVNEQHRWAHVKPKKP